jgi:hypothetical protein
MNCEESKELMVAYIEDLLDEKNKRSVAEHLKDCASCRAELKEISNLRDRLVKNGKVLARGDVENAVLDRIIREQNVKLKAATNISAGLKIRRIIMKSPITKLAAAAVIIIGVMAGILQLGSGTVTWAKAIEPILNARTIICDMIIGDDEHNPFMHEIIVGSRIRRTMSNVPNMTMVIDLDSAKMLVLDSESKTASYVDIQGDLRDRTQIFVKFLRDVITKMKDNPNIENLGEQIIDGHKAVGFTSRGPNEEVTIWADVKTALPIRIYFRVGQMCAILKNFELDALVDDSLLSMDVPPGYTKKDAQFDLGNANEQDFIESLRVWAEVIGDGIFPDAIGTENAMKEIPMLGQKLGKLNLSEEQATQMGMAFGKGMLFHQIIDTRGDKWHYAGAGVKLGEADKAIFWYQPRGAETYRVIYGDLHVEDAEIGQLPK